MALTLPELRAAIDAVDNEILALVSKRAALAQSVGHTKAAAGHTNADAIYRPEREAQILNRLSAANAGPLPNEAITRIHRAIIGACMALEAPLKVAYLGPEGTFSQAAVMAHFGGAALAIPFANFDAVFRACEREEVDLAVVPVVNSTEGFIGRTLDLAVSSPLKVCGEIEFRVRQHLLMKKDAENTFGADFSGVKTVFSHAQSLAQCANWLNAHCPTAHREAVVSNAEAARLAAQTHGAAAIAGELAAQAYGLAICAEGIEDNPNNTTRFWVMGRNATPASGRDKTSVALAVEHAAGAMFAAIAPFAQHGVSMAHIESRPLPGSQWEYVFLIDLEGHADDPSLTAALAEVKAKSRMFKILGAYPKAVR